MYLTNKNATLPSFKIDLKYKQNAFSLILLTSIFFISIIIYKYL